MKVGPSGGTDPHFNIVVLNVAHELTIRSDSEMELLNVAGFAEGKHRVNEKPKPFIICTYTVTIEVEVEDLSMFPEIAPPARDKIHCGHRGSRWEK